MLHLPSQHHLCVLQGLIVEQPVQFRPLSRGVAVLVLDGGAVNGKDGAILEPGFHPVGVHEDALDVTMAQQTELDYLIYNDPLGYADLILNGDPEELFEKCG